MSSEFRHLDPIGPQLFDELRTSIVEMRLRPGTALSEKDISQRYGVSRQPVREAFIKLSEAGLVEIRPSRGTYVRKISTREVADARFVREAIECSLVRYACKFTTLEDCVHLHELIREQKFAAENGDFARFNSSDEAFHKSIGNIVHCDYALRTVERARNQIDRIRYLSLGETTPMLRLIRQHEDITSAIEAKDEDAAELSMKLHLREILVALPSIAKANPDIFEDQDIPDHATCHM